MSGVPLVTDRHHALALARLEAPERLRPTLPLARPYRPSPASVNQGGNARTLGRFIDTYA